MSTYLRPHQISELEAEKSELQRISKDPSAQIQEPAALHGRLRSIERQLDEKAPPPISPKDLDTVVKEERELRAHLLEGMPSQEEMRKCPAGAIGKHQAWDARAKKVWNEKGERAMDAWKNRMLRLHLGTTDPDVANFERFRPRVSTLGMHDVYIEGQSFSIPSEAYKQGWDKMHGKEQDPTIQALQDELAELREMVAAQQKVDPISVAPDETAPQDDLVSSVCVCGKEYKKMTPARLKFSIKSHERFCKAKKDQE